MRGADYKLLPVTFGVLAQLLHSARGQGTIRPINGNDNGRCEQYSGTFCANVGYNSVYLPNARGHDTQTAAENEVDDFNQLVSSGCSQVLRIFLCSYYFPLCFTNPVNDQPTKVKTCRNLCEYVQPRCEPWLTERRISWPAHLNCSLSDFSDDQSCFGPVDPGNLDAVTSAVGVTLTMSEVVPTTTISIEPSATARSTFVPITPTPLSQSTTRGVLQGTDVTTTKSSGGHTPQRWDKRTSIMTLVLILVMLIYLQW